LVLFIKSFLEGNIWPKDVMSPESAGWGRHDNPYCLREGRRAIFSLLYSIFQIGFNHSQLTNFHHM
jgi:hypothetical protein